MEFKKVSKLIILQILAVLFGGCSFMPDQTISVTKTGIAMGTVVSITSYAGRKGRSESEVKDDLNRQILQIFDETEKIDKDLLSWRSETSEINHFNQSTQTTPIPVSDELGGVIRDAMEVSSRSGSALDITLRPLISIWGIESYDGKAPYEPPSDDAVRETGRYTGINLLHLTQAQDGSFLLQKDRPEVQIDLGAVGKGYVLDAATSILKGSETKGAVFAAGGSILAYGEKDAPWQIGVRDPAGGPADYIGLLSLEGGTERTYYISTSGGYEKYTENNGKIYEHIIDGRTLYPAEGDLLSATIITQNSGLVSDALSTACYLLGIKGSADLLQYYQAEAVFVTKRNEVFISQGLKGIFSLTNSAYTLKNME